MKVHICIHRYATAHIRGESCLSPMLPAKPISKHLSVTFQQMMNNVDEHQPSKCLKSFLKRDQLTYISPSDISTNLHNSLPSVVIIAYGIGTLWDISN